MVIDLQSFYTSGFCHAMISLFGNN